jgi:hypothetical protein
MYCLVFEPKVETKLKYIQLLDTWALVLLKLIKVVFLFKAYLNINVSPKQQKLITETCS